MTGAAGFVGRNVVRELLSHGYHVRALVRPGRVGEVLPQLPVEIAFGDITDPTSLAAAVRDVEVVFHIAALYREARFPDEVFMRVNDEGTANVIAATSTTPTRRLVYCSTSGVHSHIEHPPAREDYPFSPADGYQRSKAAAELRVRRAHDEGVIQATIIRPGMIWGADDTRFIKLFQGVARRQLPLIGRGEVLTHWVNVTDLARAFRLAAECPEAIGEIFFVAGDRPVPLRYVFETIASTCGVKLFPFRIPVLPLQLLGDLVETLCRPFGIEPPLHRRRVDFFVKQRAFDCSKAEQLLGYHPAQTFEDEVRLIVRAYREQGILAQ